MTKKIRKRKPASHTVANAFIISRVPRHGSISYAALKNNVTKDLNSAKESGYDIGANFRLSVDAQITHLCRRFLLSMDESTAEISWNERTERYMRRKADKNVMRVLERAPMCNPLILIAGSVPED